MTKHQLTAMTFLTVNDIDLSFISVTVSARNFQNLHRQSSDPLTPNQLIPLQVMKLKAQ